MESSRRQGGKSGGASGDGSLRLEGDWELVEEEGGRVWPAQVPGCVQTTLWQAGEIPDPYFRDNAQQMGWMAERPWTYRCRFRVPARLLRQEELALRFEGLDTLASISLNGTTLGTAANMHRTHEFEVAGWLRASRNLLEVKFLPVPAHIGNLQAGHPRPNWGAGHFQGIGYVRKAAYHFGWDWSPPLLPVGIWKPVSLCSRSQPRLADLLVTQEHLNGTVHLHIRASLTGKIPEGCTVQSTLSLEGETVAHVDVAEKDLVEFALVVASPRLWWPRGLGGQPLYTLRLALVSPQGRVLDCLEKRIGLREVRLLQQPDGGGGSSFEFAANGVPFFARGANWVPADCFPHRVTPEKYHRLVAAAADMHMNMLRVWGGGIYESDHFLDACDELGVCVWHDFAFACASYPVDDPDFLAEVRLEAVEAVRRLRHHPSLILWCGNNELEEGLVGPDPEKQMSVQGYDGLFVDLLGSVVRDFHPGCDYIRSSGHTPGSARDRRHTWSLDAGDAHIWWRVHGLVPTVESLIDSAVDLSKPLPAFDFLFDHLFPLIRDIPWGRLREIVPRFCSEWGRQSFPVMQSIREFSLPEDWSASSRVMEFHQQAENTQLITGVARLLPLPSDFEKFTTTSQIVQGEVFRLFVENWRQTDRCRGALFWTLNDSWPAIEWSQIDWFDRRKASFYIFRRFFQPCLLSFREDPESATAGLVLQNDSRESLRGKLEIFAHRMAGGPLAHEAQSVCVPAGATLPLGSLDLTPLLASHKPNEMILSARFFPDSPGLPPLRAYFLPAKPKEVALPRCTFSVRLLDCSPAHATLEIRSSSPSLWAGLSLRGRDSARDLLWSDNFFHCVPGDSLRIELWDQAAQLTPTRLRKGLCILTLKDLSEPVTSTRVRFLA